GRDEAVEASKAQPYTPKLPLEIFDDEAMQRVYDDLRGIDNPFATFEEVGVVMAALVMEETDPKELERLLGHLDDAISPLLNSAALGPLNSILRRLSLIARNPSPQVPLREGLLQNWFANLCKTQRLTLLARAINSTWEDDWKGELFTFVYLQQLASFDELIGFLNQVQPEEPRRVVIEALLLLSDQNPKRFAHLTDDASPRLACDALFALSRLEDPLTINRICGTFKRPESMVREAVINSLRDYQSPRIHRLMLDGLEDEDEDVRLAALRYLTVYTVKAAVEPISETIRTRAFMKRAFDERRGWYIALGRIAGQDALPALRKLAEAARGHEDIDEQTHLALLGIRSIRNPKARQYLEGFADSCRGELQLLTRKMLAERRGTSS
ncbi:MAG: HEAT repeat domain-containing protein, partial [Myxococcota bacterium]|nr:HEAT repeat domain-containing protein [Myxococcota bacterium]